MRLKTHTSFRSLSLMMSLVLCFGVSFRPQAAHAVEAVDNVMTVSMISCKTVRLPG